MKRALSILVVLTMIFTLASCAAAPAKQDADDTPESKSSQTSDSKSKRKPKPSPESEDKPSSKPTPETSPERTPKPSPKPAPKPSPKPASGLPVLTADTYIREGEESNITIEYPVISGLKNAALAKKVNRLLRNEAVGNLDDDDSGSDEYSSLDMELTWEQQYLELDRLSVTFTGYYYNLGAAHPYGLYSAINIDLNTGEIISLTNIASIAAVKAAFDNDLFEFFDGVDEDAFSDDVLWEDSWFEQYDNENYSDDHIYDFWYDSDYLYVIVPVIHAVGDNLVLRTELANVNGSAGKAGTKLLAPGDAYWIAQDWLDAHPDLSAMISDSSEGDLYVFDGEEYYLFYLGDMYWLSILVHRSTGELFALITEDGEDPAPPSIEPLDDYYNRYF